ncbi:MAG: hypothetical protein EBZ77_01585, partial [Chitinophagia bacterium]|nr:hypothetical protein [Chitinophagia bacterium]
VSGSRRWAQEGYVPGTFYDGYAIYGAVSKLVKNSQFNLTAMVSPTKRGKAGFSTDELYDSLTNDHFYNPNWGYQQGKKRNATVANTAQPIFIASYSYQPSQKFRWTTTLGYEFGKNRSSNIDFYNGYNPNPSYYRNLPSYYLTFTPPNYQAASVLTQAYKAHPELLQVQWDHFYNVNYINYETIYDINGTTDSFTGKRSVYVQYDKVINSHKVVFNSNFEYAGIKDLSLYGGISVISQNDEYYKELTDLLGGDYFVNNNQFAVQQSVSSLNYNQNNINVPNQLVKVGDKYGYDYILRVMRSTVWGQGEYTLNKFKVFAAAELGMSSISREGLFRNGLFPENSFGKGKKQTFATGKIKGGVTYNINVKNSVYLNAGFLMDAPKPDYTYISEATRDFVVDGLTTVKTKTLEAGYSLHLPRMNVRLSGYATDVTDNINVKRFFNDDPDFQTFVNYIMSGMNTRSTGFEFAANYGLTRYLNVTAVLAKGQSFYTNNPSVKIFKDNSADTSGARREVYLKNLFLGVGPQSIYSLVFHYHPRNYWHVNLNLNYMDDNYVEVNPDRRTQLAGTGVARDSKQWNSIYDQEKLPGAFTMDLSAGKSFNVSKWYKGLHHRTLLAFNLGIINVLNNTNIKIAGYEQLRYDFTNHSPARFPNRYGYAYGINYYLSVNLKF